jgi:hypothetical protein
MGEMSLELIREQSLQIQIHGVGSLFYSFDSTYYSHYSNQAIICHDGDAIEFMFRNSH